MRDRTCSSTVEDDAHDEERESLGYEWKKITFIQESGNYANHLTMRTVHHINISEHALYFCRAGLSSEQMIQTQDYQHALAI